MIFHGVQFTTVDLLSFRSGVSQVYQEMCVRVFCDFYARYEPNKTSTSLGTCDHFAVFLDI